MEKRRRIARGTSNFFWILAECVAVVFLCALGIFYRVQKINPGIWENESVSRIFSMAFVSENRAVPDTLGGIEWVYIQLLNGAFRLFGNKEIVGVYLQLVLQVLSVLMLYLPVRKSCGAVTACIGLGAAMLLPMAVSEAVIPSVHIVLFLAFSAILLLVCGVVQRRGRLIWYQFPLLAIWFLLGYVSDGFLWSFYFIMLLPVFLMIGVGSICGRREKYAVAKEKVYQRKSEVFMDIDYPTEQEGMSVKQMDVVNQEPEKPAVTNFIENPLPIPKRHKKPMLHFDYDVPKDKNFYDVVVADNDDFDI